MSDLVLKGQLVDAVRLGSERFERMNAAPAEQRAALGQLIGRALLALGREEEAEELFQRLLKIYESHSRSCVRWQASLDQAALFLHLNRAARAAEAFNTVADDDTAPAPLRAEALAGLSVALHRSSEHRRAMHTLNEARRLAQQEGLDGMGELLDALGLDLSAHCCFQVEELREQALGGGADPGVQPVDLAPLRAQLRAAIERLGEAGIATRRLRYIEALLDDSIGSPSGRSRLNEELRWLRELKLSAFEQLARIEAGMVLVQHGDSHAACDVLGAMVYDEQQMRRHRYALELKYCMSQVHAAAGRHGDALRLYKDYVRQALYSMKKEWFQLPRSRFLEKHELAEQSDAAKLRLPLRYRKAYQYIVDHLDDRSLSIRQVAAHIDVTERALQMAFRTYLGMTPAELIRSRRMQRIRDELRNGAGQEGVLAVATRWGLTNRSTLAHNYRQQFDETPSATLRGAAVPA
ncbi:helix-turn-helix transcriptional regulator [Aquabacterium sp. A7-Y]|uniref:helix-turn-helix transcriptional regulator n=1 Tax=Aquabacterium sp. A7-Y TaxID=1349605 RepID=UPI00223D9AA0|nr:helix-turn-helix transcriptional regulator [Aquabacterium sp. A7-Y]MCW7540296.1 helix-turn-helix transcriptional regulator [Aquabacterium sp. A7-Y]